MINQIINTIFFKTLKGKAMMHNNGEDYFWGMHTGWWFLMLVVVIVIVGGFSWLRKRK